MCLDARGDIEAESQPSCGWCCLEIMWSWTTLDLRILTLLEALFTSSQSSPFVPSRDSKSKVPSERQRSQCCVKRSAVLCFVGSTIFVLSLSTVQALYHLASVMLELLLDEICVPLEISVST